MIVAGSSVFNGNPNDVIRVLRASVVKYGNGISEYVCIMFCIYVCLLLYSSITHYLINSMVRERL